MSQLFNKTIIKKVNVLIMASTAALVLTACDVVVDSAEKAAESIHKLVAETIEPSYRENQVRANIQLTQTNLLSMLPDLAEYPMTLNARDDNSTEAVEIFTSSEKAGTGRDGFYVELATAFNNQNNRIANGKRAKIAVRKMASGLGAQFMQARRYMPDAFSPSNTLWGDLLNANGVPLVSIADVTAPNTAGIVVKKSKIDMITTDGKLDVSKLLTNVSSGSFAMGYTNPYQSSTGLNFLLTILNSFAEGDESQMLSPDVASAFEAFQAGVPFVAQNTIQMRDAAQGSGVLDALVMEHQSWVNVTGMNDYEFVPFGVPHNSPLYATPEADPAEREVLALFAKFIESQQSLAKRFGFGQSASETSYRIIDGTIIGQAQKLWKQKKSGGRPVAAVFVADVSGSMEGTRIKNLRKALVESSDLISSNNSIGLVTYSEKVNVDLFVRPFDVQQKALFNGAIGRLQTGGKTATNDAVMVAAELLLEYGKTSPDHKKVIFLLSDGSTNRGLTFEDIEKSLEWSGIPVHTIAYEVNGQDTDLKAMAALAEGAYVESSSGSASYRIGNLLNSEM
ncbi:vWA domain-containing protein [Leucothrix arctica]|uniref:VWA domain-containing protein n=1 Tax=Leucothrix arctica TaxID=1481894 RepID=A0A317C5P0_9GAMM|nr:vWA domain-containing protein [Leucothrix arctica]PWQ93914.1 VWA domain-containing protein [Leucothrix arctica]